MPDGVAPSAAGDPVDRRTLAEDSRLIRGVRGRLVAWSGLTTLVVLAILGIALYVSAATTLADNGVRQLDVRTGRIVDELSNPHPGPGGPEYGFSFGGPSSGTFGMLVDSHGTNLIHGPDLPSGLPIMDSLTAASRSGKDIRVAQVGSLPIRAETQRVATTVGDVYVQVIQDRTAEQQTLDAILRVLLLGGGVVILVAFGFGTIYARRALVPIRESLESQRAALRRQREFAADASHELRTPLTVIRSSVERLRRNPTEASAETTEALGDIDAEVGHLTALVEDLLLLARSDSGAVTLARMPVDLGDVAADGASTLAKAAEVRGVALSLDPEPAIVGGDPARLRQLIVILVDNAIRHTPRGGAVRVRVRTEGRDAVVDVEDDGPGIRPDDMPRVFERFWRAPGSTTGGTGLGLAIAKSIVDLHDGRIAVMNRPEGGARFSVRLPGEGAPPGAAQRGMPAATDRPG
jgi:signal transduction histidine kinase